MATAPPPLPRHSRGAGEAGGCTGVRVPLYVRGVLATGAQGVAPGGPPVRTAAGGGGSRRLSPTEARAAAATSAGAAPLRSPGLGQEPGPGGFHRGPGLARHNLDDPSPPPNSHSTPPISVVVALSSGSAECNFPTPQKW